MKMNMDLNKLDNQSINKNLNNRKNILRPLSLHHRRFRHLWYSFIILLTLLAYSYFPYFFFDIINSNFLERMGFSLGGRTLSSFLRKMGCPGSLALVILSLLGVFDFLILRTSGFPNGAGIPFPTRLRIPSKRWANRGRFLWHWCVKLTFARALLRFLLLARKHEEHLRQ